MTSTPRRQTLNKLGLLASSLLVSATFASAALAQDKVVKFILPNATGSGVDTITRTIAPVLGKTWGANVVVENQAGAGGVVGLQALVKAAPDGATLSVVSNNVVILPSVLKSVPFDMPGDFTPIAVIGYTPMILVVNPKVPANNAKELVALMKANPGTFNFASGGNGTILHLAGEMFVDEAGVKAQHVPYKGVGPMITDLLSGQVQFGVAALPSVQGHIKSGGLRAIGAVSQQRTPAAPEIPTFVEQGMTDYVADAWFAVVGPKGMSAAEVKKVHDGLVAAFADPAIKEAMAKQGNTINVRSTEASAAFFRSEKQRFANLVKKAGLEPQ